MEYSIDNRRIPDSIAALELTSIAAGYLCVDAMVKKAAVEILDARAVCPGKFFILLSGPVAELEEALEAGLNAAGLSSCGHFIIRNLSPRILPAINSAGKVLIRESLSIIETFSASSAVFAADAAVKAAAVDLISLRLLNGLGGKSFFLLTGSLTDIEAARTAATEAVEERDLVEAVIIAQAHPDLAGLAAALLKSEGAAR
jgi:microcompartment protein CcmL/EutN